MIQATELRLNNYVKYNGIIMSVTAIDSPKPRKEKRFDGKYLIELFDGTGFITATTDQIDGVELTEELLLGSGFERTKETNILAHKKWFIRFYLNTMCLCSTDLDYSATIRNINYLNELQNTVSALTQKELQINLHNQK